MENSKNHAMLGICVFACGAAWGLSGCASVAVWSAPKKAPSAVSSPQARQANQEFWQALHGGHYEDIDRVLEQLTAAYLANPGDGETAAHIGFSHTWRVSERARLASPRASITDDLVLSRKYFAEAPQLVPGDLRYQGFLAGMELSEGAVHQDEKLKRRGYFDLMDAKDAWPEFNLFTAGYVLSSLPYTDDKYHDALEYQWQTLDRCVAERVDRKTAAYARYMSLETLSGSKRVCWNSWIAPHNFEGFFLNMGDMLVKAGDPETARHVYADAKLSKTYASWPYREVLEARITQAADNVDVFRKPAAPGETQRAMMGQTAFACMACHQER
jgi:hypothetical protein